MLRWRSLQSASRVAYRRSIADDAATRAAKTAADDDDAKRKLKDSLNLPSTSMPMRHDPAVVEPSRAKAIGAKLYAWQRRARAGATPFTLQDGPPYANGDLHVGHFLNKVLKDTICRAKLLRGHLVTFRPGWDCHGLPIELKAELSMAHTASSSSSSSSSEEGASALALRRSAAALAGRAVEAQRASFERWGIMADWDAPYYSMDPSFEAAELEVLRAMHRRGLISLRSRPVHWSPATRTALAEAELEYVDDHLSTAAYIAFELATIAPSRQHELPAWARQPGPPIRAVVWTTTPWTIPANQAVCAGSGVSYSLAGSPSGERLLVATARLEELAAVCGEPLEPLGTVEGRALDGLECVHPLSGRAVPLIAECGLTDHVTDSAGTGLVHTAPAHGMEDFAVGRARGLSLECAVDADGRFTGAIAEAAPFAGLHVLDEGSRAVLDALRGQGALLAASEYRHRYPYDWRAHQPVIFRSTPQWFANLGKLRETALSALDDVSFVPPAGRRRLEAFVGGRSEWCISRQRAWGVPIPAFYKVTTGEALLTDETIAHFAEVVRARGADAWWSAPLSELLPPSLAGQAHEWTRGTDTLDVWFDSGCVWAGASEDAVGPPARADLYLEGSDQHRGWFQSSLLTHVGAFASTGAATSTAPYRAVVTHGFVMDESGVKMSKSRGNALDPAALISGATADNAAAAAHVTPPTPAKGSKKQRKASKGKAEQRTVAYGADVLRLWVATSNWRSSDVTLGPMVLEKTQEVHRRLRNSCRFILGNLHDFDPDTDALPREALRSIDRWALSEIAQYTRAAQASYDEYAFSRLIADATTFATTTLSSHYFGAVKDRLYCATPDSDARRAAQTVLHHALDAMVLSMAPVLPFTAEEVHSHRRHLGRGMESVFYKTWDASPVGWHDDELIARWRAALGVKAATDRLAQVALKEKRVAAVGELRVEVLLPPGETSIRSSLLGLGVDMNDLLGVSAFRVGHAGVDDDGAVNGECLGTETLTLPVVSAGHALGQAIVRIHASDAFEGVDKCRRCWRHVHACTRGDESIVDSDGWRWRGHPSSSCLDFVSAGLSSA